MKRFSTSIVVILVIGLSGAIAAVANTCFNPGGHPGSHQYPPRNHNPDCDYVTGGSIVTNPTGSFVTYTFGGISDPDAGDTVTVTILGVTSSEATSGLFVGDQTPDWQAGSSPNKEQIRSEAKPTGLGRLYTITVQGADTHGGTCTGKAYVLVKAKPPNHPPDCSRFSHSGGSMWPANHQMVTHTFGGITDPDGDTVTTSITGVSSNEAISGLGGGDVSPDWGSGGASNKENLRAERWSRGHGRTYTVSVKGDDGHGGTCTCTASITVP